MNTIVRNIAYLVLGIFFGIILFKSEVISWFRIQEMFRFHSFHMYGVLMGAMVVGSISVLLLKKFMAMRGRELDIPEKPLTKGTLAGGFIFGMGWALTGACPGPIYALMGGGYWAFMAVFASALGGAWLYGMLRNRLPH